PPPLTWLAGPWHVTHSTLSMWKSKRNVRITYTPLASDSTGGPVRVDDLVEYQTSGSDKVKSVHGVDTAEAGTNEGWAWNWRGKGWLVIATSRWETLGYGTEAVEEGSEPQNTGTDWVVTFFSKTLFTPAGVDIYSRKKEGLRAETVEKIKEALKGSEDDGVAKLAETLFEIEQ
ncbi:hypothetical protein BDY21DRAFT_262276, partial [Lineolata rhizophorae]